MMVSHLVLRVQQLRESWRECARVTCSFNMLSVRSNWTRIPVGLGCLRMPQKLLARVRQIVLGDARQ